MTKVPAFTDGPKVEETKAMDRDKTYFLLLNIGHFLDHLFTLVFATVAALVLYREWNVSYAELLAYATPGSAFSPCRRAGLPISGARTA